MGEFGTIRRARRRSPADVQQPPPLHLRAREAGSGAVQRRRRLVRGQGAWVRREAPGETPVELRAYGRRTFLAVTGIGLSSLLWAKPVWQVVSGAAQPLQARCRRG